MSEDVKKIKVLSLFSGIGAFERALENLNIPYELLAYCDIDKWASKAYSILHNVSEGMNVCDVKVIDPSKYQDVDLVTYGFPCQDISLSGKLAGLSEGTRSGLVWTAHKIIAETKPKIALCENVKNLTSKKFANEFKAILKNLEDMGYNNYWQVLCAKDYGVPQNRERVFIVSILKEHDTGFAFPKAFPLQSCLKDYLEKHVEEKYYLSPKMIDVIGSFGTKSFYYKPEIDLDIARPLTATMHKMHRASTDNYVSDSFVQTEKKQDILVIRANTKKGFDYAKDGDYLNVLQPNSKTRRGRVGHSVAQTLDTSSTAHCVVLDNPPRVRRLIPAEAFALMGFTKDDAYKLSASGISDTQLYKMAGNSIVVNVLMEIFRELYKNE